MTASSRVQRLLVLVLVMLVVAIGVVLLVGKPSQPASTAASSPATGSQFDGPTFPGGLHAANFSLLDQSGHRVTLSSYRGKVVVLTFIHSLCHDACPFMVEQVKGALNTLAANGRGVPVIGISVAPSEDTVASRRAFLAKHRMAGRLAFLSGPPAALRAAW